MDTAANNRETSTKGTQGTQADDSRYAMNLHSLFTPLELIDVSALAGKCKERWYNQTLCRVNDSVIRVGVVEGEFHWHKHDNEDEFFYVVEGRFIIDLEEANSIELAPGQAFLIPKGVPHRPRATERTVVLMVEGAGVIPTGD